MGNISTKLNLAGLKHTRKLLPGQSGQIDCLIIPIKENHLFIGEKGLYLDLQHFELSSVQQDRKDTHLVKQSLPKEVYDAMTEDQRREMPILGNSIVWGTSSNEAELSKPLEPGDDLPF